MGRIYNIVLDSNYSYNTGVTLSNYSYYINWESMMPEGSYKMKWSFQSTPLSGYDDDPVMGLALPLGGNDYFSSKNVTLAGSTQFVGFISTKAIGTTNYLFCDQNTNPPIYLQQRPNVNVFTVFFSNGVDLTTQYNSPNITSYLLVMSFEALDS